MRRRPSPVIRTSFQSTSTVPASRSTSAHVTASASPIRSPVASIYRVRLGRSRRDARRSASIAASHRARSSVVRARGEGCPEARSRPASLVGLTETAPYRTASPLVRIVEGRDPSDPQLMKPNPNVLLRTLRDLNAPAESAVIVGDSITDIKAGLAADIWTIGYANKPGKDEAMRDVGADAILGSMSELGRATRLTPVQPPKP
jgi:hypothetical protein